MRRTYLTSVALPLGLFLCTSCASTPKEVDEHARAQMLSLLLPARIEIVEPFTRVSSFDADTTPDGIELLLQAVNSFGDPGLMIAGSVRVELYEYVAASGISRGARHAQWNVELSTDKQQRTYWNQLTQMYEFRLAVDAESIPPADKYVLLVTYEDPLGERLTDEFVVGNRSGSDLRGSAPRAPPRSNRSG